MDGIVGPALVVAWVVVVPILVARLTYRIKSRQLVILVVALMWVFTTIVGGVIYLVARRWYRGRLDTTPIAVEPVPWALSADAPAPAPPLAQRREG